MDRFLSESPQPRHRKPVRRVGKQVREKRAAAETKCGEKEKENDNYRNEPHVFYD